MISVVIPAYNAEQYIEKAIESILVQTYSDVEIIVVNDGSLDATKEIVQSMARFHANITLINVENGGVSKARNIGMQYARGDFVAFLDADDEYLPYAFEKMLHCINEKEADICVTFSTADKSITLQERAAVVWDSRTAIEKMLQDHPCTHGSCANLYRTSKLRENQIYFPEGKRVHEDNFFVALCILSEMKYVVYPITTYLYRRHDGSASRSGFSDKMFDMLELADKKVKLICAKYPEYANKAENIKIKAHMALLSNLCKTSEKKYKQREMASLTYVRKNKKYFVPSSRLDRRWFFIIVCNLYWLYKMLHKIKHRH